MRALLDANVLIALMDANHVFHLRAHKWFQLNQSGWASCPLTENGLVRVMTRAGYRSRAEIVPTELIKLLREFAEGTNHKFWPDAISIREPELFQTDRIHSANQITDLYLLALAIRNGGRLVTFDARIPQGAVRGATADHVEVLK